MQETRSERIPVLDHGYLEHIECWGSDQRIVESARMSTDTDFRGWGPMPCRYCGYTPDLEPYRDCSENEHRHPPGDERLLRFLWLNQHTSPFEMAGATFEVQLPIFVARQWMRHRTFAYNEYSARYAKLLTSDYLPGVDRLLITDTVNKQAGGQGVVTPAGAEMWLVELERLHAEQERVYGLGLDAGVPRELARLALGMGRYTRMRVSGNLRNWLHFLALRLDPHAQLEIQVYAEAIHAGLTEAFPRTLELFDSHRTK